MALKWKGTRKVPTDYPLYSFRLPSQTEKDEIETAIVEVLKQMSRAAKPDEGTTTKSQVISEALRIGLKVLKKRYSR